MYLNKTKRQILKIISVGLSFVFIFSCVFPQEALASRSDAGGGDLAEFDVGKWALGTAISVVSLGIGSAVSSGINTMWEAGSASAFSTGFTESISSWSSLSTWADKYAVFAATSQVSNAVGRMGRYYDWDPGLTLFVSSVGSGIVGGAFNPSSVGTGIVSDGLKFGQFSVPVTGIINGMALGAINGAVEGGILMSLADEKGKLPPWAGPVAGLAGNFATGAIVGGFSQSGGFSFSNGFNPQAALGTAVYNTLRSLPSAAIGVGVNYLTEDMDRQDAFIVKQAFSGLYRVADTVSGLVLPNLRTPPQALIKRTETPSGDFKAEPSPYIIYNILDQAKLTSYREKSK